MFLLIQAAAHMWMDLTFQDTRGRLTGKMHIAFTTKLIDTLSVF